MAVFRDAEKSSCFSETVIGTREKGRRMVDSGRTFKKKQNKTCYSTRACVSCLRVISAQEEGKLVHFFVKNLVVYFKRNNRFSEV